MLKSLFERDNLRKYGLNCKKKSFCFDSVSRGRLFNILVPFFLKLSRVKSRGTARRLITCKKNVELNIL